MDLKFLVDGRKVWVALPHPAWVEYKKRTGKAITDSLALEIAGHYLKAALEAGEVSVERCFRSRSRRLWLTSTLPSRRCRRSRRRSDSLRG